MQHNTIEAIKLAGIKIPPCPQVLIDIQRALQDTNSKTHAISRLIERDMKLSAAVFKVVNSVQSVGNIKKFSTIDQAITVLGRNAINNIVKTAAIRLSLSGTDHRLARFWDRSLEIATLCSIVAHRAPNSRRLTADQAFTAGLFHDCGVAVLMQHYPNYCEGYATDPKGLPEIVEEDKRFRACHCIAGLLVAEEWGLPDFVCETVQHHHSPLINGSSASVMATAILLMSAHISNINAKIQDREWPQQRLAVVEVLGLSNEDTTEFELDIWTLFEMFH